MASAFQPYPRPCGLVQEPATSSAASSSAASTCREIYEAPTDHAEVMACLVRGERQQMPDPTYLTTRQHSLKPYMVATLYEWLADVCLEDQLLFQRRTLDKAIRNVHRFLSVQAIAPSALQLVGAASLLIAYKLFEVGHHDTTIVKAIVDFGAGAYTNDELFAMEKTMTEQLQWHLRPTTAIDVLEVIVDAEHKSVETGGDSAECRSSQPLRSTKTDEAAWKMMTNFIFLAQCNYMMVGYSPSVLAGAAYAHARHFHFESASIYHYSIEYAASLTGQSPSAIIRCIEAIEIMTCLDITNDKTRSITPPSVS